MIDIHSHILPFIDDGSASLAQSVKMLEREVAEGVTDVIATPHYRFDYSPSKQDVLDAFELVKAEITSKGLSLNLYLGQEIYVDRNIKNILSEDKVFTVNQSKYILIEFDLSFKADIAETVYELKRSGFIPIVAHIERYFYCNVDVCEEVKRYGGLIQVNASSLVGKGKRRYAKLVKELFNRGLVDFIASDLHFNREAYMSKCYKKVSKKYGETVARAVFVENARKIIKG